MNATEGLLLMAQLLELEEITQKAMTPDGRWRLLQDFLAKNPEWEKQVNQWIELTPTEAFIKLRSYLAKKAEIPAQLMRRMINEQIEARAKSAIEKIQQLYKTRKAADDQKIIGG